jgi:calcineurin-like phosphoesterase family protein
MNNKIIENWNNKVTDKDDVYVLGDFCFGLKGSQEIFNSLKGKKYLVQGNHDKESVKLEGWQWIKNYYELSTNNKYFVLFHYPMRSWNASFHGSYHLYGHCHGTLENDRIKNSMDVGVDKWNFTPISIWEVCQYLII